METITDLSKILNLWVLRLRRQRAFTWSLRGLITGLVIALIAGLLGLSRARLLREEFLALMVATAIFVPLISGLVAFLWQMRTLESARYFDRLFGLNERVSTALEINAQMGSASSELIQRQLQDAVAVSSRVDARQLMPLGWKLSEVSAAFIVVILIGAVWLRGDRWFNASQQAREVEQAVSAEIAEIEDLIEQIEANEALTEEQKEALTNALEVAQQSLNDNPSLENSVSMLTSTGEELQSLSDAQSQELSQALQQTGSQLAAQDGSPLQSVGEELAQGDAVSAATRLDDINVAELSTQEQQQLADQLDAMAEALSSTNPQVVSELSQAADALRSGDTAAAQQALNNGAQSLAQAGQQITFAQAANQAAGQLQEGAGQVLAAGGGAQQANQSGQGQGQGQNSNTPGGSGSGSGSSDDNPQTGDEAGSDPIAQNNGPGDGGTSTYEQIYAPTLLGGEGGPAVGLPDSNNGDGDVIGQGPVAPGEEGTSLVPYSDVFSQYEQVNNQAIENGEVPSQFLQIIKNYFNSLEP